MSVGLDVNESDFVSEIFDGRILSYSCFIDIFVRNGFDKKFSGQYFLFFVDPRFVY